MEQNEKINTITAEEFDRIFDEGKEDVIQYVDMSRAIRPNKLKRINVDFPTWLVNAIDKEADRIGVTRQSLIKVWLSEKVEQTCIS